MDAGQSFCPGQVLTQAEAAEDLAIRLFEPLLAPESGNNHV